MFYIRINTANEIHSVVVLCILYHISMEDQAKSTFTYTDCIPTVSCLTAQSFCLNLHIKQLLFISFYGTSRKFKEKNSTCSEGNK